MILIFYKRGLKVIKLKGNKNPERKIQRKILRVEKYTKITWIQTTVEVKIHENKGNEFISQVKT